MHPLRTALILVAVLAALFWFAPGPVLALFGAVLAAVALRALALPVAGWLGLAPHWGVLIVALLLATVLGVVAWFGAASLAEQADQFLRDLPGTVQGVRERLSHYAWGRWALERISPEQVAPAPGQTAGLAVSAAGALADAAGNTLLVILLGVYLAADPQPYRDGALALLAPESRARGRHLLDEAHATLRGWLLGQLFAMIVSGLMTWLGLWLLDVPLAGLLALLTALCGFIPYIGPVIAGVPAVLIALGHDPSTALWVVGLFLLVQNVEGNVLTPLVQSRAADLPPAVLLGAQLLMGAGFGLLGILLAAPLAAVTLVAVRIAYVEGWVERS